MPARLGLFALFLLGLLAAITGGGKPAAAADLAYFYCYAPNPEAGTTYMSDVHPVGPVAERRHYGEEFASYLNDKGLLRQGGVSYCVMRATMSEIDRGRSEMAETPCLECTGAEKIENVAWPRGGRLPATKEPHIADLFKVQNDKEWTKLSKYVKQPNEGEGPTSAYCYQNASVDSVIYHTGVFATTKDQTSLALGFADEVAKITRIQSAMSTHCYVSSDTAYLQDIVYGVAQTYRGKRFKELKAPR